MRTKPTVKNKRVFKGSWFLFATIAGIVVCEILAWKSAALYGVSINPLVAAFLGIGIVAVATSVIYDGYDIG